MGLMDKMKAAAQDVATQAKSATAQAQTKIELTQTRKKADEAAQKLGYLIHKERTQGMAAGSEADALIAQITSLEAELAAAGQPAAATPAPGVSPTATPADPPATTSPTEPTGGDSRL
jgi:septal ring factor EnvC (AmiA/AmiB activator)